MAETLDPTSDLEYVGFGLYKNHSKCRIEAWGCKRADMKPRLLGWIDNYYNFDHYPAAFFIWLERLTAFLASR